MICPPGRHHLDDTLGGILQIGINQHHCIAAAGVVDTCTHGQFFAEATTQINDTDAAIFMLEHFDNVDVVIGTAVIDEQYFNIKG